VPNNIYSIRPTVSPLNGQTAIKVDGGGWGGGGWGFNYGAKDKIPAPYLLNTIRKKTLHTNTNMYSWHITSYCNKELEATMTGRTIRYTHLIRQGNGVSRNKNLSGMAQCIQVTSHHPTSLRPTLILLSHICHVFPFRLPDQKYVYIFYHYHAH